MNAASRWRPVAAVGMVIAAAGALQLAGGGIELVRLGLDDDAAFDRIQRHVTQRFDETSAMLAALADDLAADPVVAAAGDDSASKAALFAVLRTATAASGLDEAAVTVYDAAGGALAWTGRPSEIAPQQILGDRSYFAAEGSLGLRLVYIAPLRAGGAESGAAARSGSLAAELVLSPALGLTGSRAGLFRLPAPIADAAVRVPQAGRGGGGAATPAVRRFELRSPLGDPLLEAEVAVADLQATRSGWRRAVTHLTLLFVGLATVLGALAALRRMPRRDATRKQLGNAGLAAGAILLAAILLHAAAVPDPGRGRLFEPDAYRSALLPGLLRSPADLLLAGALAVAVSLAAAALLPLVRPALRRRRRTPQGGRVLTFALCQAAGGVLLALAAVALQALTRDVAVMSSVDLLHTSLAPWDAGRLALLCGLILAAVATLWGGVAVLAAVRAPWRHARGRLPVVLGAVAAWAVPPAVVLAVLGQPLLPGIVLPAGTVLAALLLPIVRPRFRHASQAARTVGVLLAFIVPALLWYPTLAHHADGARRALVETRHARQAARYPADLQRVLYRTLEQIDALPELDEVIAAGSGRPGADRAFAIWRQTELAQRRLTSAVELYDAGGGLISRFALNFPEYAGAPQNWMSERCEWEVFGEAAPFGSQERRILHGERAVCAPGAAGYATSRGSVVVHLALDYQALPFISPRNPYVELLRETPGARGEQPLGPDVDLVIYGWGLQPLFTSGPAPWFIDDALFERIYASREPFWTTRATGGQRYNLHVVNNRAGIYALGYPAFGMFDHLVRLVEITALAGLGCLALLLIGLSLTPWTMGWRRFGRGLLRDIRTSFYRRLLLAFVAATVIPVLALALVIRIYVSAQLRAEIETGAARTATIAQRVIEESFGLQQEGEQSAAVINDDLLVFISEVIDQNVHIFEGPRLLATSERDLFASGLLPTRTPAQVYDAVALSGLSSYVTEDAIGDLRYLVAATPLGAAGRDAILTVPLTSRQQEIEDQIAGLDRGILIGVALFVLLGSASGYYLAERIADPVKRLTRATGRIARGDFDARVVSRSADELQRLVAAFNRMAGELKDQQQRLERTHRLEAWHEMARQVAHEIKNPLTPVQLSAEHLLRVNRDRGDPLGPVFGRCVESILAQVRILRQIATEFSSYASSPAVRRVPTDPGALLREVIAPYRPGLEGRIDVTLATDSELPAVSVDRTLLVRALTNVVDNALHAMPGSGALALSATVRDGSVELAVRDTGVGLDEAALQRIFEPYFSTKVSGTGLGMAIARRNVELCGGAIRVESRPDEGTLVRINLPAQA